MNILLSIGLMGSLSSLQKSDFLKLIFFILPLVLVPKLRSVAQNERKKTPIYFFPTFGSKINKFDWKKTKKQKTLKLQAILSNFVPPVKVIYTKYSKH